jgi:alcohol dehydrogenase (NADP+)
MGCSASTNINSEAVIKRYNKPQTVYTAGAQPYATFNNGVKFPVLGLGTFLSAEGDCKKVVYEAVLNHGYRHIDTASVYANEEVIGEALQEVFATGKVKREEVFISTKLWQTERDDVEAAVRRSL